MGYQALYRTWRPQRFEDVVGQEMITKTLQNAVITKQISHAYLFTGPRGTGKTSTAKILAKAINCHHQVNGEPCNKCVLCKAITNGSLNDVFEIDAASNNGVEEIRNIRDKVKYAPTEADYKVYIIDEVHMLSTGAFNALLKTLEEPPANVVFILATTEPHKIPATIISRTQRFDFHRITAQIILKRMQYILDQKKVSYDKAALRVIARAAEGGMRDALSILDQVISFGEDQVTLENALLVTGSVTKTDLLKYLKAVVTHQTPVALTIIHQLVQEGKDATQIIEDLIQYCRDLLLYQQSPQMIEKTELDFLDDDFKKFAAEIEPELLYHMINILNEQQENMRYTSHTTIYLEVLTIKLSQLDRSSKTNLKDKKQLANSISVSSTQAQVEQLQQQVKQLQEQLNNLNLNNEVKTFKGTPLKTSANNYLKVDYQKVDEVLKHATRQDLNKFQQIWGELINDLSVPHKAIMNTSKPVAASTKGVVIGFQFPYLCQKAMVDPTLQTALNKGLSKLAPSDLNLIFLPNEQWLKIRQDYLAKHRPEAHLNKTVEQLQIVSKAQELFGSEIVNIKED